MALQVREQVLISSAVYGVTFAGTVLTVSDSTAVITATEPPQCDVGNVMHVQVPGGYRAMAVLSGVEAGECPILTLTGLAWAGARPRASRQSGAYRVRVDFMCGPEVKRTIGETTDLSTSGVRVKLRSSLAKGDAARLVVRFGETESLEVLGRVTRIVQYAGDTDKGFDVAFRFERWIRGEDLLYKMLNETPEPMLDSWASPEENANWFTLPEVA